MKKNIYKIIAGIGAFIGVIMLIFRSSKSSAVTDIKLKENKKKLDKVRDNIVKAEEQKKQTKKKVNTTKKNIADTKKKKKSTKSATKKAKNFKNKYKRK
jgi:septal ring factor EnvC (AmiA/AmiB activator)